MKSTSAARRLAILWLVSGCGAGAPPAAVDAAADVVDEVIEDVVEVPDESAPTDPGPAEEDEGVEFPWDLPEVDLVEADPDVGDAVPGAFGDCPELGISAWWVGEWEGVVTYELEDPEDPEATQQGLFLVGGELSFEIQCLDKKLLVAGTLSGLAEAAGEVGVHPFAAKLYGDYNYITREIDAQLLDGEVRIFKVISVFFEGNFDGASQPDGTFAGEWDAVHVGNDLELDGTAEGYGTWTAGPSFEPPGEDEPGD